MLSLRKSLTAGSRLAVLGGVVLAACGPQTIVQTEIVPGTPIVVTATPAPTQELTFESADPTTLVNLVFGLPETLDPALDYETGGGEVIQNVYDTLIFYDRENPTELVPQLAMEVPSVENGGISADGKTVAFRLRSGVTFHDGTPLNVTDVAYTFQRGLLQGGSASPQWLLYEAFFGTEAVPNLDITDLLNPDGSLLDDRQAVQQQDPAALEAVCLRVKDAIVSDPAAGTVTFHLAQPWGPLLATLAQPWGSIQSEAWVRDNGGWDGDCKTWPNFYAMTSEEINATPIGSSANGTGPYVLHRWTPGEEVVLKANPTYWRTEPAWEAGPTGVPAIETIVVRYVEEWGTRLAMMQTGDADIAAVGSAADYVQIDEFTGEVCTAAGPCAPSDHPDQPLRAHVDLPTTYRTDVFLNFVANSEGGNNFIGSGTLDGDGVPADFFSDVHIRRAFAYCFDWASYIADVQNGEGVQAINVMLPGMIGYDETTPHYEYDPVKCEEEFRASQWQAPDGTPLWDLGFRMTIAYNSGNAARQAVAEIFQANLSALNEKFVIEVTGLPWPSFLQNWRAGKLPMVVGNWQEDVHDPHNWVVPYSVGFYGGAQSMPAELVDQFKSIVDRGVAEPDPAKRTEIYREFNMLFSDQVPTILLAHANTRQYQQRWVRGFYHNPIYQGFYYYSLSKE